MVLKRLFPALSGAVLLLAAGGSMAADYRPDQFLGLDLSKAVLSPTPLGPPARFAPVAVEARSDRSNDAKQASRELLADPKKVAVEEVKLPHAQAVKVARAEPAGHVRGKPRGVGRVRLAHRHGNPLNAEAMDTRIQKWPCNPDYGGICNWRH